MSAFDHAPSFREETISSCCALCEAARYAACARFAPLLASLRPWRTLLLASLRPWRTLFLVSTRPTSAERQH
jgi:hypothetical protein